MAWKKEPSDEVSVAALKFAVKYWHLYRLLKRNTRHPEYGISNWWRKEYTDTRFKIDAEMQMIEKGTNLYMSTIESNI